MKKGILYTIIAICIYYLSIKGLELLLITKVVTDFFLNLDESYWLFLDLFVYLSLIVIAIIFIKVYGAVRMPIINRKITIQSIIQVFIIVILFRIIEDPILRMYMIIGDVSIPVIKTNEVTPLLELTSMVLRIVLLAPILEELLFRRIILNFYEKKYIIIGVVLSSLFFAFIHFNQSYTNYISVFLKFMFGLVASHMYIRKGLFYSILFHISYNILWLIINENVQQYWSILQKLHFGVWYWIIVVFSFGLILHILHTNRDHDKKVPKLKFLNRKEF